MTQLNMSVTFRKEAHGAAKRRAKEKFQLACLSATRMTAGRTRRGEVMPSAGDTLYGGLSFHIHKMRINNK